jgi:hypothetical protein
VSGSAYYWTAVGFGTLVFGLDIVFVKRGRESARLYPAAVALLVAGLSVCAGFAVLAVVLARALRPGLHFFAGTPTVVVAAIVIVLLGGLSVACVWQAIANRRAGPRPVMQHDPTPEELAAAEAFDDDWQAAYRLRHHEPRRPRT